MDGAPRIERLAARMREDGIDAFFASDPITMGYLAGFREDAHERFMTLATRSTGETRLICPALSEAQARRAGISVIAAWPDGNDPLALFAALASDWDLKSGILAVDDAMPAQMLLKMQSALPAALFKPGQETLSALMRAKDAEEILLMQEAASIADRALLAGLEALRPGASERQIEKALNRAMEDLGGKPTFCIVAAGPNGAEPHHFSDETPIQMGDVVVMDFGCGVGGYQSDITRMASCGKASVEAREAYRIVLEAHRAGRSAAKAGVPCGAVDRAARGVIESAGYGAFFTHRTGHGIGLHSHEEPYIVGGAETILAAGDCFSVEPGIYLPGKFGVRIENILTINAQGAAVSLNQEPPNELPEL